MRSMRTFFWIVAALAVIVGSLALVFLPTNGSAQAAPDRPNRGRAPAAPAFLPDSQIFNDDLYVEPGQVMEGDVTVLSGSATVASGGAIHGNLIVMSGDIEIEAGGVVQGDVTTFSGDIALSGRVDGDVAAASGDIELVESAHVQGNVSILSGEIDRAEGARVDGSIFNGPEFSLPFPSLPPGFGATPGDLPHLPVDVRAEMSFAQRVGLLILRLLGAALITLVVVVLSGLVMAVRPNYVESTTRIIRDELVMSFGTGLVVNLALVFLLGIFVFTVCLIPVALVPLLLINLLGWVAISHSVGARVATYAKSTVQPAATVALGALALTAPVAVLWAFGGCFRAIMVIVLLVVSSAGAGAVVLPWLRKLASSNADHTVPTQPHTDVENAVDSATGRDDAATEAAVTVSAPASTVHSASLVPAPATGESTLDVDDFSKIRGLGPMTIQRLRGAGVQTFSHLAALSVEQIGDILGWSTERVIRNQIVEQAQQLT